MILLVAQYLTTTCGAINVPIRKEHSLETYNYDHWDCVYTILVGLIEHYS
jgi:hypothetical protein